MNRKLKYLKIENGIHIYNKRFFLKNKNYKTRGYTCFDFATVRKCRHCGKYRSLLNEYYGPENLWACKYCFAKYRRKEREWKKAETAYRNRMKKAIDSFNKATRIPNYNKPIKYDSYYYKRHRESNVKYSTYASRLSFYSEDVRRDIFNRDILEVRCKNSSCKKWFKPNRNQVNLKLQAINGTVSGESNFYCSEECKQECILFNAKPQCFLDLNKEPIGRLEQYDWARMVKERDNYECQICGATESLKAHHIESLNQNPVESADVDNGITLCKECHLKVHSNSGCRFIDLTKMKLCN